MAGSVFTLLDYAKHSTPGSIIMLLGRDSILIFLSGVILISFAQGVERWVGKKWAALLSTSSWFGGAAPICVDERMSTSSAQNLQIIQHPLGPYAYQLAMQLSQLPSRYTDPA